MTGTTSVPRLTFGPTGPVLPTEVSILAGVQADQNAAFGGNLDAGLSTPQGQLAQSEAAIIADKNSQIAFLSNQFDPQFSTGRWQDGLGRIYFMDRLPSSSTTVMATVSGLTGTVIPVGSLALAIDGTIYSSTAAATIPVAGNIDIPFAATVTGPVVCPSNSLNSIYRSIPGWDSINNTAPGIQGRNTETALEFEIRRQQSVSINSQNSVQAIRASVLGKVPGIIDAYVIDNPLATSITIGSVTILAHSLYVCVAGGAAADIAQAIWSKKAPGCDYNGTTTYTVYDTSYAIPQPTYLVKWTTATATPIKFAVSIANSPFNPPNIVAATKAAILSAFNGGDGGPVASIGSSMFASRFYPPVQALATQGSAVSILSLKIGTTTATLDSLTVGINQKPTLNIADITVTLV